MNELFQAFSAPFKECDDLNRIAQSRTYTQGEQIISRDDPGREVYFILSGEVKISAFSASGQEVWYNRHGPGKTIGEMSAITGQSRSADVVATKKTTLAVIQTADFLAIVKANPDLCFELLKDITDRLSVATVQTYEIVALNVPSRVCAEILRLLPNSPDINGEYRLESKLAITQLAKQLNSRRETVSKVMSILIGKDLLKRKDGHIIVKNIDDLMRVAET